MRWVLLVLFGLLLIAGGIFLSLRGRHGVTDTTAAPSSAPATQVASTAPATAPVAAPERPKEFFDVVRARHPAFATTKPLAIPVAMSEAARFVIDDPMYLDFIGELWITRADAEATSDVFKSVHERRTHVLRDAVVFVHRWPDTSGVWQPQLICRKPDGGFEIITRSARQDIPGSHKYEWHRAFSWNDAIVVPTDRGISVVRPDRKPMEVHHEFIPSDMAERAKLTQVQALLDWRGLVAWMPWEEDRLGSRGAARFVDGKWSVLDGTSNWPDKLLHLVPLLDGSVLQLVVRDDNTVDVALSVLDPAEVEPKKITDLVAQLSDVDSAKREAAFGELTRYGMGIWPILERMLPTQPPEAKMRIEQLLSAKLRPTLGGMTLVRGPAKIVARADFGAAMIHAEAGVTIPRPGVDDPALEAPAWISIQPGRPVELAPDPLVEQLKLKNRELRIVRGEMILSSDTEGPRWWLANHFSGPMLKGAELEFKYLIGQDGRGRSLFRKNLTDAAPTLVIDPTLLNPTPRFPVWVYKVENGQAGWNADNWPAIKSGGAWALVDSDWKPLDETKEQLITEVPRVAPTTAPATTQSLGTPILSEADGTRFYDGRQTLHMILPNGKEVTWNLPPEAVGEHEPLLLRAGDNRLFLFNAPGRIVRIKPTPSEAEPFRFETVFTKQIPNADRPNRIWLDPAGRIIIAYDGNSLAICFPTGRIPAEIAKKMSAAELNEADQ